MVAHQVNITKLLMFALLFGLGTHSFTLYGAVHMGAEAACVVDIYSVVKFFGGLLVCILYLVICMDKSLLL